MVSTSAGRNGGDGNDATITHASETMSKSSARNRSKGRGRLFHIERGGHQGRCGRGR